MSLSLKKRLVSSTIITESNNWDAFGSSFACTRNLSDPRKDPCGTPQLTYIRPVLLFLPL